MSDRLSRSGGAPLSISPEGRIPSTAPADRRLAVRTPAVPQEVLLIPVLPDGRPDWDHRAAGQAQDVSPMGLGLKCDRADWRSVRTCVVGTLQPAGTMGYAGLEVRTVVDGEPGPTRLGGPFAGLGHDLLRPENLTPVFHPGSMGFKTGLPESVLRPWAEVGVLVSVFVDCVEMCPRCHGLASFRRGCPTCGSARISSDSLIHHFACAHVSFVADFEVQGELACPKCRARGLIVGADFEYLKGPYRCLGCNWSDTQLEHVGQCLSCGLRFPNYQAFEMDLRGYLAERLDPLALVATH